MPKYNVKTKFIFEGEFTIEAENSAQAKEYVEKHCAMTESRGLHSSLPDEDVNWDFSVHPKKVIGRISKQ